MSLVERLRAYRSFDEWGDVMHPICSEAAATIEAQAAEIARLREELGLWMILVNEGGVPRYTVTPGAALNTVVTSTKRLLARASLQSPDREG